MKKRLSLLLIVILIMGCSLQVNAESNEVGMLTDCTLAVGCTSNGIAIDVETHATKVANKIGVKDIYLVEINGSQTKTIKIAEGSTTSSASYGGSALYPNAVPGRSYYAYCTHYAVYGSVEKTVYTSTDPLVYN